MARREADAGRCYGPSIEAAVKRFQEHQGVTIDGVWTETEWALLVINATANGRIIKPTSGGQVSEVPEHDHNYASALHSQDFQASSRARPAGHADPVHVCMWKGVPLAARKVP
ncbi:MAG: peptidoglycan-binding protein [Actinobacteria bacterium]|nr:peptidoglycan-binding protein [Actinomycetota bacterium]